MNLRNNLHRMWLRLIVAVTLVAIAMALRIWPLQGLGSSLAYLTFYPAVMIAAVFGGLPAGLFATVLSALIVLFWSPTDQPFIVNSGDWLGMAVFLMTGTMISAVAEAMRRAEARARRAREQAEAANRAKSVFLATMSHELRTPLNAILGFSDLMRSDPAVTQGQRENLGIIQRSGEQLLNLINDVLDMAKIDAGRAVLEIKPYDLGAMVRDVTDMLGMRAREKGLQLRIDQSSEFPRFIRGDEAKLRQVLVNLTSNAVRYTNRGTVTLRLGVVPKTESPCLFIEVADTGVGISKADQARIFESFVQVGKPGTQKGTGLGLSIVRRYVELMGGRIEVESAPGRGSLFRVEVPVQQVDETEVEAALVVEERVIGLAPGQPEYRILIVEDQLENWLLLQRLLQGVGFTVMVAQNGAEGVALFQTFRPHFIWMDRRMPEMDGLEATRRIRALDGGKDVKIAAVTASAFEDQRAEMLAAGMDDFVRKPYQPAEIFDCLARQLGVRFAYAHAAAEAKTEEGPALSPDAVAALPKGLRQDLADALVLGNVERIDSLMGQVEHQNANLAKALKRSLDRFDYLPILRALEAAEQQDEEEVS